MKYTKFITAIIVMLFALVSCNKGKSEGSTNEQEYQEPNTMQYNTQTDSTSSKKNYITNDGSKLSDGKDSVTGEITPPNASKQ